VIWLCRLGVRDSAYEHGVIDTIQRVTSQLGRTRIMERPTHWRRRRRRRARTTTCRPETGQPIYFFVASCRCNA